MIDASTRDQRPPPCKPIEGRWCKPEQLWRRPNITIATTLLLFLHLRIFRRRRSLAVHEPNKMTRRMLAADRQSDSLGVDATAKMQERR